MAFVVILGLLVARCSTTASAASPFDPNDADPTTWARLEYVNFWTSHAALSAPLATTGDVTGLARLEAPQTRSLLGPGNLPSSVYPAMRFTLGGWLYDDLFGGELSVFSTALRATHFSAESNSSGSPLLAVPFSNVTSGTPQEDSLVVAKPGVASGRIWADDVAEFFGIDLDGLLSLDELIMNPRASVTVLGGVRVLSFRERFTLSSGSDFLSGASLAHNDIFMTNDSFTGVDLGLRGNYRLRRWTIQATARAAIGGTFSTLYIGAQPSMALGYPRIQTVPGEGWFAEATNIGRWYRQAFSVVPAAQLRVGYDITSRLRLTVGYEAFFWTRMLRAPNQIDRQLNLTQAVGPLIGPAHPVPQTNYSNFWAQGFTVAVQFNY